MAEQRVQRRLSAILAADVVGFGMVRLKDEIETAQRSNLRIEFRKYAIFWSHLPGSPKFAVNHAEYSYRPRSRARAYNSLPHRGRGSRKIFFERLAIPRESRLVLERVVP